MNDDHHQRSTSPQPSHGSLPDLSSYTPEQIKQITKIQALVRGRQERNRPQHPMKFVTWRNTTNPSQAEHMAVKFGSSAEDQGNHRAHYEDFRQGSKTIPKELLAPFLATNKLSGLPEEKPYYSVAHGIHTPQEHKARFLARPALDSDKKQGRDYRYDSREYIRATVSSKEWLALKRTSRERQEKGVFHLFGEAPDPYTTRCMTHIEQLAQMRGQRLDPNNPSLVARQFHELNRETTTAPKLRTFQVKGAERNALVPPTTPVRNFDGRRLDHQYWDQQKSGAHDVGRKF
jgi:hypothetical protein